MKLALNFRQRTNLRFQGLIVLALDLELGLELFDLKVEARDLYAKFLNVGGSGLARWRLRTGIWIAGRISRVGWSLAGGILLAERAARRGESWNESFRKCARPCGFGRLRGW